MRFDSKTSAVLTTLITFSSTCATARGQTCAEGQTCIGKWAAVPGLIGSGPGLNGSVLASVVFNEGSGDVLYVGGSFSVAGDTMAANIAKWDGANWSALGTGMNGSVHALMVFDDGSGPALYAGGEFTTAGNAEAYYIAKWDGSSWSTLGLGFGGPADCVYVLTVFDDGSGPALYAGGEFTTAGGVGASNIAKWDEANWSALGTGLGTGMGQRVRTLTVFDDGGGPALYAGGSFTTAGGASANHIAKWDGANWSALGTGMDQRVLTLTVFDDGGGPALYAGGFFTTAGGASANCIAKWDGANWSALGTGMNERILTLTVFDDGSGPDLYAGGLFTTAGATGANYIAKWDGANWSTLGAGMDGSVYALTVFNNGSDPALYAGGAFTSAGGVSASHIAKWDGVSWSTLGNLADWVCALTVLEEDSEPALCAGGDFTSANTILGGVDANRIAKWQEFNWWALGTGMNDMVRAIIGFDWGGGRLYAGGDFTRAGDTGANYIAKWDGANWSDLDTGMNGRVRTITGFDDGSGRALYAGGDFTTAGSAGANRIAKWDGANWSALDTGMNGLVHALTAFDDGRGPALYVGGDFTTAGATGAYYIAKWDGANWSTLGAGMNGSVYALTIFDYGKGPALYAGGDFTTAGGAEAHYIAKWDGANWSALDTGMNGSVHALTAFDDGMSGPALYAGGNFTTAGGGVSAHIAQWVTTCSPITPPLSPTPDPNGVNKSRYISFVPGNSGVQTAIRVKLTSLHHVSPPYRMGSSVPFTAFEGQVRWVGPPGDFLETEVPPTTFRAAALQCTSHYGDWSTDGLLHVFGTDIVPSSAYEVQVIALGCDEANERNYAGALVVNTTRWGDVVAPFNPPSTTAQPDFSDISSLVNKFKSAVGAPIKASAQLHPSLPDPANRVNFLDIASEVEAYKGLPYPFTGPLACPYPVPACGNGILDPGEECDDHNLISGDRCSASCLGETRTAVLSLRPVTPGPATPPYPPGVVIAGNEIRLPSGGIRVWLQIEVTGWAPQSLRVFQAQIDSSGFTSGEAGTLTPAVQSCTNNGNCRGTISGITSGCALGEPARCVEGFCQSSYQNGCDPAWIGSSLETIYAVDAATLNRRYGCASNPGEPMTDFAPSYGGTLVLDVPVEARGTFTIGFDSNLLNTFLYDDSSPVIRPIPIAALQPAMITILNCDEAIPDCNGDGVSDRCNLINGTSRDCNSNGIPDECDIASMASADCNANGVPDECETGCITAEAPNVANGETVTLDPGGGSGSPTQDAQVSFTNQSGAGGASVTVNETTDPVHPSAGGYRLLGTALIITTSLGNGEFRARVVVPFAETELLGANPMDLDLAWYNVSAGSWILAVSGNIQESPVHSGSVVGDRLPISAAVTPPLDSLSNNVGDYGVFWNTAELRGFVWANVDHASAFAGGIVVLTTPVVDLSGLSKARFISFAVPAGSGSTALRVKFNSLHHVSPPYTGGASIPFTMFEGQSMFVGPPTQYVESASSGIPFYASQLQCAPEYRDWSTVGLLHVMGEAIVPSSTYNVENLAASCTGNESSCTAVSPALEIKTTRWGDVETPYNPPTPDPQPDTSDISALINKFKSALGAPIKARALLAGGNARGTMGPAEISPDFNFTHISLCVDAFKGLPYPYKPGKCTGNAAKACAADSDCTAQSTTGPCVLCP